MFEKRFGTARTCNKSRYGEILRKIWIKRQEIKIKIGHFKLKKLKWEIRMRIR